MLESLRNFFQRHAAPGADDSPQPLHVAAAALLLEMAHADGTFSADERVHIEQALGGYFDLPEERVRELIELADAQRREAVDLHQFTSLIVRHYDEGQRYVMAELLWRVVLADGELSQDEDALLIRLARLLDLRPGYLAGIKKKG